MCWLTSRGRLKAQTHGRDTFIFAGKRHQTQNRSSRKTITKINRKRKIIFSTRLTGSNNSAPLIIARAVAEHYKQHSQTQRNAYAMHLFCCLLASLYLAHTYVVPLTHYRPWHDYRLLKCKRKSVCRPGPNAMRAKWNVAARTMRAWGGGWNKKKAKQLIVWMDTAHTVVQHMSNAISEKSGNAVTQGVT